MLKIKKLYSEPEIFEPITFVDGLNLILGVTTEGNEKTNGVGKSMSVEFINYALMKRHSDSRVSLIPSESLSRNTAICLDFELNGHKVTSKRTLESHEHPTLVIDGLSKTYLKLSDAIDHLSSLLFNEVDIDIPLSFRMMMGPLIRDEGSEFKSIINCFDTNKRIPPDYTAHLYLLNVDPEPYVEAKRLYTEMDNVSKARKKMEENITALTSKNVSESKADLNELEHQVRRIQTDIDQLENIQGYDTVKNEIIAIENKLEEQRSTQGVIRSELAKIKLLKGDNYIDNEELAELYNHFKLGLGDLIKRELDEVTIFKKKIDDFQRSIMQERKDSLENELSGIDQSIFSLNRTYKEKVSLLDQKGLLISLKQTIAIHEKKIEELAALSSFIKQHAHYDSEYKAKKRERDKDIYLLESYVNESKIVIQSVEQTILDMHEYIFGNRRSSLDVKVSKSKEILEFELRTESDGSHSINREKVFLYDFALLVNQDTSKRHPGLLVHDNIFDVDQDTLIKSINYVSMNLNLLNDKQYILTINSDKFSDEDLELLDINLEDFTRAAFTKDKRFLRMHYQELRS